MVNGWNGVRLADTIEAKELKAYIARAFMDTDQKRLLEIRQVYDSDKIANDIDNRFVQLCQFCLVEPMEMAELCVKYARTGNHRWRDQMEMLIHKGEAEKLKRLFDA